MLDQEVPPLVLQEALLEPHLAAFDVGEDLLQLGQRLLEALGRRLGFLVVRRHRAGIIRDGGSRDRRSGPRWRETAARPLRRLTGRNRISRMATVTPRPPRPLLCQLDRIEVLSQSANTGSVLVWSLVLIFFVVLGFVAVSYV